MPITEKQRQFRAQHVGSSDVPALLGVDRFKNTVDVWMDKTGKTDPVSENEAMYIGTRLEDGVLDFAADKLGKLIRNQYRSRPDIHLGVNIDAILVDSGAPVEAKTAGILGPTQEPWGDEGTDQVPERVIAQCHAHMMCCGADICYVAALIGGRGFAMFEVARNAELCTIIEERCLWFWSHVESDTRPDLPDAPHLEVMRRYRREPNKSTSVDSLLVEEYQALARRATEIAKRKDEAQARLLEAMGDAEAADAGQYQVTYMESTRKAYAVEAKTYRQMRIKERKS